MKQKLVLAIVLIVAALLVTMADVQSVTAQANCRDNYEPNNEPAQSKQVQSGQIQATICSRGDVDVYKFNLSTGDTIHLSLTNLAGDYDLALYSQNHNLVGSSENSDTASEEIRWTADRSGVVYIVVFGYDGAWSTRPYSLNVRHFPRIDLSDKTRDPSAQLAPEVRRKLITHLTQNVYWSIRS